MARTKIEKKPENKVDQLKILVPRYAVNKTEADKFKKLCDVDNTAIKTIMTAEGIENFEENGYKVNCTISTRESFDEDKLIAKLKELKIRGVVKKKEFVDNDALESAIYNGKLNASELKACQITKEVVTLRLSVHKD